MKLVELIPISKVGISMIKLIAKHHGIPTHLIDDNIEVVDSVINGIKESGKYESLSDVLEDQELISNLLDLIGGQLVQEKGVDSKERTTVELLNEEVVEWQMSNPITCPYCENVTTLQEIVANKYLKE